MAASFDAWTPETIQQRRRGPSRDRVDVAAPIMPTFVFAREHHVDELLGLAASPINPHPPFSVFRYNGGIPTVYDREIDALRTEEGRARLARLRTERHTFGLGTRVQVPDGPFAGLSGVVENEGNGRYALVCFGEWRLKVATFLLRSEALEQNKPIVGAAA